MNSSIILVNQPEKSRYIIKSLEKIKPFFLIVIGTTETSKIPGISAAGKNPEITDYTPAADVELLTYGRVKSMDSIPVTPEGIPTPAIITMSAICLSRIPFLVVMAGAKVMPKTPYVDLGGSPGSDIRSGNALKDVEEVFERAKILGEEISSTAGYVIIGESVPGGTTTALATLLAMGVDAIGKVSSSLPKNPHELKKKVALTALNNAKIRLGDCRDDPLGAMEKVGDPTMPAMTGIALGASKNGLVVLAGGTQMATVVAALKVINKGSLEKVIIGTTRWIAEDRSSNIKALMDEIYSLPILAINLDFSSSKYPGLRSYEEGVVKEGVGAGGMSIASILYSGHTLTSRDLLNNIEENYGKLVKG